METKLINFFKYLEDKGEQKIPLKIKFLNPKQFEITPEDLKVGGTLILSGTPITSLPNDLKVGGYLNLRDTKITSLPNGLEVRNNLDLSKSSITSLPKDLKVGGKLYLFNTPLSSKTEAEIRRMTPNIKGKIYGVKT